MSIDGGKEKLYTYTDTETDTQALKSRYCASIPRITFTQNEKKNFVVRKDVCTCCFSFDMKYKLLAVIHTQRRRLGKEEMRATSVRIDCFSFLRFFLFCSIFLRFVAMLFVSRSHIAFMVQTLVLVMLNVNIYYIILYTLHPVEKKTKGMYFYDT